MSNSSQAKRDKATLVSEDAYNNKSKQQRQQQNERKQGFLLRKIIDKKIKPDITSLLGKRVENQNNRQCLTKHKQKKMDEREKKKLKKTPNHSKRTPNVEILRGSKQPPTQNYFKRYLKRKCYFAGRHMYKTKTCSSLAKVVTQFLCPLPNFSKGI